LTFFLLAPLSLPLEDQNKASSSFPSSAPRGGLIIHRVMEFLSLVDSLRRVSTISREIRAAAISSGCWLRWCEETHNNNNNIEKEPAVVPFFAFVAFRKDISPHHQTGPQLSETTTLLNLHQQEGSPLGSPISEIFEGPQVCPLSLGPGSGSYDLVIPSSSFSQTNAESRKKRHILQDISISITLSALLVRPVLLCFRQGYRFWYDVMTVILFLAASVSVHTVVVAPLQGDGIIAAQQQRYVYVHYAFTWVTLLLLLIRYTFQCCIPEDEVPYCLLPIGFNFLYSVYVLIHGLVYYLKRSNRYDNETSPRNLSTRLVRVRSSTSTKVCAVMLPSYMTVLMAVLLMDRSGETSSTKWYTFTSVIPMGVLAIALGLYPMDNSATTLRRYFPANAALVCASFVLSVLAAGAEKTLLSQQWMYAFQALHASSAAIALLAYIVLRTNGQSL